MNATFTQRNPMTLDPCIITAALGMILPVILGAAPSPGFTPDLYAAAGAMPASVLVLLYLTGKGRGMNERLSAFIGAILGGMILPGAALWKFVPEFASTCTWHVWAFGGVVGASVGWAFVLALIKVADLRAPRAVKDQFDRYVFRKSDPPKDESEP